MGDFPPGDLGEVDVLQRNYLGRARPMPHAPNAPRHGDGAVDEFLAECGACRRTVRLDDDFGRLRESLYHLNCLLTALRELGHEAAGRSRPAAALRDGIAALRNGDAPAT